MMDPENEALEKDLWGYLFTTNLTSSSMSENHVFSIGLEYMMIVLLGCSPEFEYLHIDFDEYTRFPLSASPTSIFWY
jgi:hypothetical protein